jgi:FHS family glucose/mannose:H+ symporter-like MFS transporter
VKTKILLVHVGFALTGVVTTMLAPILPLLASQWHLNDAQAGRLFLVQFIVSPSGAVVAAKVLSRWGASWTVPIGMILIAFGAVTMSFGTFSLVMLGIGIYSLGLGFALPSTNLLVVELVSEHQASALNILNFSWTLGAVLAPLAISAMKSVGLRGFLLAVGAIVFLIGVIEAAAFPKGHVVSASTRNGKLAPSHRLAFAVVTFLFLFLYVGIENGFSGWVPTFTMRSQHLSDSAANLMQSSFWASLLLGRLTAPLVLRLLREGTFIVSGLALAALGILLAILSPSVPVLEAGVVLAAFGLAGVFPTGMAIFAEWYGTSGAGSIVFGLCGLGGALVPWLVGIVSTRTHDLRIGFVIPLACVALASVLYGRMAAYTRRAHLAAAS